MSASVIVGRYVIDPLMFGYTRGFYCGNCGRELQLSPTAACMVQSGAGLRCRECPLPADEAFVKELAHK